MDKAQQELIQGYLAKAREKVRVARDLCTKGEWDDAISRAYYAAYHAAQAALLTRSEGGGRKVEQVLQIPVEALKVAWRVYRECIMSKKPGAVTAFPSRTPLDAVKSIWQYERPHLTDGRAK